MLWRDRTEEEQVALLQKDIETTEEKLRLLELSGNLNPFFIKASEKKKLKKISEEQWRLLFNILVDTVTLDPRYRNGNWRIDDILFPLIKKGLAAG